MACTLSELLCGSQAPSPPPPPSPTDGDAEPQPSRESSRTPDPSPADPEPVESSQVGDSTPSGSQQRSRKRPAEEDVGDLLAAIPHIAQRLHLSPKNEKELELYAKV